MVTSFKTSKIKAGSWESLAMSCSKQGFQKTYDPMAGKVPKVASEPKSVQGSRSTMLYVDLLVRCLEKSKKSMKLSQIVANNGLYIYTLW